MAQHVSAFPSDVQASLEVIRKEWMDGKVWKIELGKDFLGSVFEFETACEKAAKKAGMNVRFESEIERRKMPGGWDRKDIQFAYVQFTKKTN